MNSLSKIGVSLGLIATFGAGLIAAGVLNHSVTAIAVGAVMGAMGGAGAMTVGGMKVSDLRNSGKERESLQNPQKSWADRTEEFVTKYYPLLSSK